MSFFDKTRGQAQKRGTFVPIKAKWRSLLAGLPLLAPAQAWLNGAVVEIFGGLTKPKNPAKPTLVYGMESYNIVLHLAMEVSWTTALLQNSTISEEAHLQRYVDLLNQIAAAGPQPALRL